MDRNGKGSMPDLDGLYAAIEDNSALEGLADSVAKACGTRSAMLRYASADGTFQLARMNYWPVAHHERYFAEYADGDPWIEVAQTLDAQGRAMAFDGLLPPEQFIHTTMFNELFRPIGDDTGRCVGVMTSPGGEQFAMGVHRALGDAQFTRQDTVHINEIYGHTKRILRLRSLLESERRETRSAQAMLDGSDRAILLVDKQMRILRASQAAIDILNLRDGLCCRDGELRVAEVPTMNVLQATVRATIDKAPVPCSAFSCHRPSGRPPYRLIVLPAGMAGDIGALIMIDDTHLADGDRNRLHWLQEIYQLTRAEMALAEGLLAGETIDEVASRRAVGRETIRSQLKTLFAKTGTRRQTDLVVLLTRLPGPSPLR